jgi:bile acid:Na+ symporter, BASS family
VVAAAGGIDPMVRTFTRLFPLWAVLISVAAYNLDRYLAGLKPAIIPLLAVVMFGMGMTLEWIDFKKVFRSPRVILVGFLLQYLVMPGAAYVVSIIFGLSPALTAGVILVGCSPGGTASNVITYLANGDVALSVTLTLTSTVFAVALTPLLTWLLLNHLVPVPALEMLRDILQIVLLPVLAGTAINSLFKERIERVRDFFPLVSTLAILVIIAIIVALNRSNIEHAGPVILLAVMAHNLTGLALGYAVTRLLGYDERVCRTIGIEVGMQNSGLAVALAIRYFSAAAALPGAIFSVWHNISGSVLAGFWRHRDSEKRDGS